MYRLRGLLGLPISSRGHRAVWGWSLKQCCAYYTTGIKPYGSTEVLTHLDPVPYPEYLARGQGSWQSEELNSASFIQALSLISLREGMVILRGWTEAPLSPGTEIRSPR